MLLASDGPWTDVRGDSALFAGTVAGLAGGAAEILWIGLYQEMTGGDSYAVAREVAQSVFPGIASVPLGIVIHMGLAATLGISIAMIVRKMLRGRAGTVIEAALVIAMLAAVWAINFFVVLPAINPGFLAIVPPGPGLVSKLLFGIAAASVFWGTRTANTTTEESINVE